MIQVRLDSATPETRRTLGRARGSTCSAFQLAVANADWAVGRLHEREVLCLRWHFFMGAADAPDVIADPAKLIDPADAALVPRRKARALQPYK